MLEEKLNLDNSPHFKQGELERRMDDVLKLIDEGKRPVMIHDRNDRRFLMFAWDDFFTRFGWLYSKEEIAAIEAACAKYEENTSDLVFR